MVQQTTTHGETMILAAPGTILIASKSEPNGWHRTTVSSCDCKSWQFRRTPCRHMKALRAIAQEAIERTVAEQPVEIVYPDDDVTYRDARQARIAAANAEIWD